MQIFEEVTLLHKKVFEVNVSDKLSQQVKDKINLEFKKLLNFIIEECSPQKINQLVLQEMRRLRNEKIKNENIGRN